MVGPDDACAPPPPARGAYPCHAPLPRAPQRGKFCGRGRFEYARGGYYDGEYLAMKKGTRSGVKQYVGACTAVARHPCGCLGTRPHAACTCFFHRRYLAADGKRDGRGVRVWVSGNRYEGEWRRDKMDGFGVFEGAVGGVPQRYEGMFEAGHRRGRGVCHYGNTEGKPFICHLGNRHVSAECPSAACEPPSPCDDTRVRDVAAGWFVRTGRARHVYVRRGVAL